MSKDIHKFEKRPTDITWDLWQDMWMWKETYKYGKRPMYVKRDIHITKDTYKCVKRPTDITWDL